MSLLFSLSRKPDLFGQCVDIGHQVVSNVRGSERISFLKIDFTMGGLISNKAKAMRPFLKLIRHVQLIDSINQSSFSVWQLILRHKLQHSPIGDRGCIPSLTSKRVFRIIISLRNITRQVSWNSCRLRLWKDRHDFKGIAFFQASLIIYGKVAITRITKNSNRFLAIIAAKQKRPHTHFLQRRFWIVNAVCFSIPTTCKSNLLLGAMRAIMNKDICHV